MQDASVGIVLGAATLDRLMPMHMILSATGHIASFGPTLAKLDGAASWQGQRFLEVFAVRRPGGVARFADLQRLGGRQVTVGLCDGSGSALRGVAAPLGEGQGLLLNLSFGVHVVEAVRRHRLNEADFAPTDLALELLYLVEAKNVLLEDLRQLTQRLSGAKSVAEEEASTDALTGLRNRRALEAALDGLIRAGAPFGMMHLDLDYFKAVNDSLGHAAGDHVLRRVGAILRSVTRQADTVARVGGDEFVLLLPGITTASRLRAIATRIITRITRPIEFEGQECRVSTSIGMTVSELYAAPAMAEMLADADLALYAAKHAGRGRHHLHTAPAAESKAG
jgi:diguanylate cyclase (GGDEF)-like protein